MKLCEYQKMVRKQWSKTMNNIMKFKNNYKALITYDPDIEMFRGEFIGLNGGADFYAKNIDALKKEGQISLDVFLRMCKQDGVSPRKNL